MHRSIVSAAGVLVLGAVLILVNSIGTNLFGRFYVDLTEEGLYTLSPGSKSIVSKLTEPITIRFYLSRTDGSRYPALKLYGDRISDLLKQYERASKGLITVETYDPRPDSDEESWAQKYGLTPLAMPSGEQLFFGLVAVNARGDEESIPIFNISRQEFLEYDISRLIYSLNAAKKPVVGILTTLKLQGGAPAAPQNPFQRPQASDPWVLVSQLQNLAELRFLPADSKTIPDDLRLLMVIHPKGLTQDQLYAIDQFVMKGGNLFVAIDPYCNVDQPAPDPSNPMAGMFAERSSNLAELLTSWGVELVEKKAVGDINLATRVNAGEGQPVEFVLWPSLVKEFTDGTELMDRNDVITSQLESLVFPWPGALNIKQVPSIQATVLLKTTPAAMLFEEGDYKYGGGSPQALLSKYQPGLVPQTLAVRLTGKFPSNFKERIGEAKPGDEKGAGHLLESVKSPSVVVVSDVDFLSDMASVAVQQFLGTKLVSLLNDNLVFAANVVENLLGSEDLISLRSRGQFTRPFTKVQAIEREAQNSWKAEEDALLAKLQNANDRLAQLQSATGKGGEQVLTTAVVDELKRFREERQEAQKRLREVRRNLRQDKERLGSYLFALNTFLVPVLLIVGTIVSHRRKPGKAVSESGGDSPSGEGQEVRA